MDIKYHERKQLCSYDLDEGLFEEFNIEVFDLQPLRNVFLLQTNRGKRILKKINYDTLRLEFIVYALNYIKDGFSRVINYDRGRSEKPYVSWEGEIYTLLPVIEGRECEVSNPVDINFAVKGIKELHLSSKGIEEHYKKYAKELSEESITKGSLSGRMDDDLLLLMDLRSWVKKYNKQSPIDNLFLKEYDYLVQEVTDSIEALKNSKYIELSVNPENAVLCHGDLAHHNILIRDEKSYFLDFDYCSIDLRVKDVASFIEKSIKGSAYDLEKAEEIINLYNQSAPLTAEEMELIYIIIKYPKDYIDLLRNYYFKGKSWEERTFLERLERKLKSREDKKQFLEEFKARYKTL